jgi:hypothetical protein
VSCEFISIGGDIALYMQGAGVQTPVIPFIHFKGGISSHYKLLDKKKSIYYHIKSKIKRLVPLTYIYKAIMKMKAKQ